MTRNTMLCVLPALAVLLAAGCASSLPVVPVYPPGGILITNYSGPLTTEFDQCAAQPSKEGRASTLYFREPLLGTSYAWDKADTASAMRRGGITVLAYADFEYLQIFGFFGKFTVVAHGD